MKGEVRGLMTGTYHSDDGSVFLNVSRADNGVMIEVVDKDADTFYAFVVDKKKSVFEFGEASKAE